MAEQRDLVGRVVLTCTESGCRARFVGDLGDTAAWTVRSAHRSGWSSPLGRLRCPRHSTVGGRWSAVHSAPLLPDVPTPVRVDVSPVDEPPVPDGEVVDLTGLLGVMFGVLATAGDAGSVFGGVP